MIYAMSDIHGHIKPFLEALSLIDFQRMRKLILLGDYIHGPHDNEVLDQIIDLQKTYGDKIVALMGNHEEMAMDGKWPIDEKYLPWIKKLPRFFAIDKLIFVHAGIDEEAMDLWKWGTEEHIFTEKYPAQLGYFEEGTIIAGHIYTHEIAKDPSFHDIYYDGESHYFLDGAVHISGKIPVLKIDGTRFYQITKNGDTLIKPYSNHESKRRPQKRGF